MISTKGYFYSDHHNVENFTAKYATNKLKHSNKVDRTTNNPFNETISGIKMNVKGCNSYHGTNKHKFRSQSCNQNSKNRSNSFNIYQSQKNQFTFQTIKKILNHNENIYHKSLSKISYKSNINSAFAANYPQQNSFTAINKDRYKPRTRCFTAKRFQKENLQSQTESTKFIKVSDQTKELYTQQTPSRQIRTSYSHTRNKNHIKSLSTNYYQKFQDSAALNQSQESKIIEKIEEKPCNIEENEMQVSMVSAFIPATRLKKRQKKLHRFYNFLH